MQNNTLCALLCAFLVLVLSGTSTTASAESTHVDQLGAVQAFLDSPSFILSRTELRHIDPDPVPELIKLATETQPRKEIRVRAIRSLSLYQGDKRSEVAFQSMLRGKKNKAHFPVIINAYLEAFGEDAVPHILPFLTDRDPKVRTTVVKALGVFGGQSGYDALVSVFKQENHPGVRSTLVGFVGQ